MKIKKVVTTVITVIVVLLLIIILAIGLFGGKMIKAAVEVGASNALGVPVTLGEASLSLLAGKLELEDLQVNNPPEFEHEKLLTMGRALVDVSLTSLTSDTVVIQNMIFDEVTLVIEQKGLKTNLQTILDSLPEAEPEPEPEKVPEDPAKTEEKPAKNLKIANLEIKNVQVKAKFLPIPGKADTVTFKLAPIKMTNLGSDDKMTVAKLASEVLMAIAKGVAQQGTDYLPAEIIGPLQDISGKGLEVLKGATDIGTEGLGKGADGIKKGIEGIGDGLKGIFSGKKKEE